MTILEEGVDYVRRNIDMDKVKLTKDMIYKEHGSLMSNDPFDLDTQIIDLLEEFGEEKGLPEEWWDILIEDTEDIMMML